MAGILLSSSKYRRTRGESKEREKKEELFLSLQCAVPLKYNDGFNVIQVVQLLEFDIAGKDSAGSSKEGKS